MARILKYVFRSIIVLLIIAAAVAFWKREQITRLMAVNSLFAEAEIVNNFSRMDTMFLTRPIDRGDKDISPLPVRDGVVLPPSVNDWITERRVTSLLIMKDGKIVAEDYFLGTGADDLRISWSVAKSYLSALFGIVMADGQIESLDDPVTKYVPKLVGTAYDGVSIRNVLNMASGVKFNEDYLDFYSDINRMGRVLALDGTMDGFAAGLSERAREPGQSWQYVSIDTHVIGMVIRGATGRDIADLLSEKIIKPLALQAAPNYITDGQGVAFVLGGLNVTTRDYARFGQMIANGGLWNGVQIVPRDWLQKSTRPSAPTAEGAIGYGFQWWMPQDGGDGEYFARGIYGQYIYINEPLGVMIVSTAADRNFREPGVGDSNTEMFRKIAKSLQ